MEILHTKNIKNKLLDRKFYSKSRVYHKHRLETRIQEKVPRIRSSFLIDSQESGDLFDRIFQTAIR